MNIVARNDPGRSVLMMGNEAIARGALVKGSKGLKSPFDR